MLAVMSTEVFGIILAGYGSGSKWALFGGMREAAQMVSYEVPMAMCVLVPVIVAGSMDLNYIARAADRRLLELVRLPRPVHLRRLLDLFHLRHRQCKRAPFDLAEAESELVAGFHTEYSGLRWSFFFMAEYASMFAVSGIATLLFLGGWNTGLRCLFDPGQSHRLAYPILNVGNLINAVVFILKALGAGLRDDVGALDVAAAAHRSGDDDLPEIPAADQLLLAAGRERLGGVRPAGGRPLFPVRPGRDVPGHCRLDDHQGGDDAQPAAHAKRQYALGPVVPHRQVGVGSRS